MIKNILMGTAYEAAVVHSQKKKEVQKLVLLRRQSSRLKIAARKRMLLFSAVNLTIEETDQKDYCTRDCMERENEKFL